MSHYRSQGSHDTVPANQIHRNSHVLKVLNLQVESMEKVVRLLDLEKERTGSNMYTFANMDDDLRDLEELEIEEVSIISLNNTKLEIIYCFLVIYLKHQDSECLCIVEWYAASISYVSHSLLLFYFLK